MTEASADQPVRLGPAAANILRSIWHQKELLVLGLVLGLGLGWLALPKVLSGGSTYDATIRMAVDQSPATLVAQRRPAIGTGAAGSDAPVGASPDVLKDVVVAENVLTQLRRSKELEVPDELTGPLLIDRLTFTPLEGTSYVDLTMSDGDPRLAGAIVQRYAVQFANLRNRTEAEKLQKLISKLEALAASLPSAPPGADVTTPAADVRAQIRAARVYEAYGDPTSVLGEPIVTTNGPPLSRKVTLALGLLLGLAIGAGAGLLVETAFRKVVTATDAEEASGLPFIAEVRKAGIRRAPLPVIERPFSPAAEDYRRVGTALERQGLGGDIRVLAIASAEPGDGRTMLAANLAHSLARQGREVVLVSSDLRRPELETLLGLGQGPGLADALQDDPIPAVAMLVSINDHLLVLPAGRPSKHPGELLASKRLLETIQTLRQMGIIILDTPPARHSADAITLSGVADATLFVAKSGVTRMRSVREATDGLRRDRIRQLGVILVGTRSPWLRSLSTRGGDFRDQPEEPYEELEPTPTPAPRTVPFSPRPVQGPEPAVENGERGSEVADLQAKERNRRAAE
ncbi:MAG TPA: CpsD/CapB family tyrosine-protein kinase [Actinomycetes bacterium]|nr:CpsD/CapB family tyrosine-protein kinase [Actinomycetes bacterium]